MLFLLHEYARQVDLHTLTLYRSGIFSGSCSTSLVNHGVNIVGYGSEAGADYWIVRNQWGTGWGEGGYIRMLMGANQCNIEKYAQFPVVKA